MKETIIPSKFNRSYSNCSFDYLRCHGVPTYNHSRARVVVTQEAGESGRWGRDDREGSAASLLYSGRGCLRRLSSGSSRLSCSPLQGESVTVCSALLHTRPCHDGGRMPATGTIRHSAERLRRLRRPNWSGTSRLTRGTFTYFLPKVTSY